MGPPQRNLLPAAAAYGNQPSPYGIRKQRPDANMVGSQTNRNNILSHCSGVGILSILHPQQGISISLSHLFPCHGEYTESLFRTHGTSDLDLLMECAQRKKRHAFDFDRSATPMWESHVFLIMSLCCLSLLWWSIQQDFIYFQFL